MNAAAPAHRGSSMSADAALAELVEGYLARLQAGEAVSPSEFAAQHPEHAGRLERLLPALELMDDLRRSSSNLRNDRSLTPVLMETPGIAPGLLGDFQILREVGRGGMGVVYEARQISLNRRVALKVLPLAAAMDSRQLQRFHVEAQAAACLHHTNIVPIHAVGCERGVHYYAMQFIDGQTLASVIGELRIVEGLDEPTGSEPKAAAPTLATRLAGGELAPAELIPSPLAGAGGTPAKLGSRPHGPVRESKSPSSTSIRTREFFRTIADLGIQAAEALEHAHGLGVIHRDIKPANLLVDDHGTLWITDFGLARLQSDAGLTMTGDLMGTLRYMSPEQALGRPGLVDFGTDIYSLGVTLYEVLTLRPAFPSNDRQQLLRQIADEDPLSPRRLNPAIPRELETIVLKAMAKEPEGRYGSAQELADDLRRFLESKPIRARRPTLRERAAKWVRRHITVVIAALVGLTIAVATLGASTVLIARARSDAERQRDEARSQRVLAEKRSLQARRAVDTMYSRVAEQWLADQPRMTPLQKEFLEEALRMYEEFAEESGADPEVRREAARAYRRVGDIESKLGRSEEAATAYRRGLAIQETLAAGFPNRPEYRRDLANNLDHLAVVEMTAGRLAEAEQLWRRSLALREELAARSPADREDRWMLESGLNNLSILLARTERLTEAEEAFQRAAALLEKLLADSSSDKDLQWKQAALFANLGNLKQQAGRLEEARRDEQRAVETVQALVDEDPKSTRYRNTLAQLLGNLGGILGDTGRWSEAQKAHRRAVELLQAMAAESPEVPTYREKLAGELNGLGRDLLFAGRPREAEPHHRRALELLRKLTADSPGTPSYRFLLAHSHEKLGNVLQATDRPHESQQAYESALALFEKLTAEFPKVFEYRRELVNTLSNLAELLTTCQDPRFRDSSRALGLAKRAVAIWPERASAWASLGIAHYRMGDWNAAIKALEKALELTPKGDPDVGFFLAMACSQQGAKDQARRWYDKAVEWMEKNGPQEQQTRRFRDEAAALLGVNALPTDVFAGP